MSEDYFNFIENNAKQFKDDLSSREERERTEYFRCATCSMWLKSLLGFSFAFENEMQKCGEEMRNLEKLKTSTGLGGGTLWTIWIFVRSCGKGGDFSIEPSGDSQRPRGDTCGRLTFGIRHCFQLMLQKRFFDYRNTGWLFHFQQWISSGLTRTLLQSNLKQNCC